MNWRFTDHLQMQLNERQIPIEAVLETLEEPDEVVTGKRSRKIYHKLRSGDLMRVVTEGDVVITVYVTSKLKKYYRGGVK